MLEGCLVPPLRRAIPSVSELFALYGDSGKSDDVDALLGNSGGKRSDRTSPVNAASNTRLLA